MKKPLFDEWDRILIRGHPNSLMYARYEILKAKRDIGRELVRIFNPIMPYSAYITIACFVALVLIFIFAEPV